jgi:hypothetical protein
VVDYETESLFVKSLTSGTNRPVKIDAADIIRLKALRSSIGRAEHRVGDALKSILELLAEAPAGLIIDLDTSSKGTRSEVEARAYSSLCGEREAIGKYDVDGKDVTTSVTGLGCYTKGNECLGRW